MARGLRRRTAAAHGPGRDKTEFLIFDHWGNFDYFEEKYVEVQPPREISLMERVFVSRVNLATAALEKNTTPGTLGSVSTRIPTRHGTSW